MFSPRAERDAIFGMLTVPSDPTTCGASCRSNWTSSTEARKSTRFAQVRILTKRFFQKITKIPSPLLLGLTSFAPHSHFLSGVFIRTYVIFISFPRERERLRSMCAPTRALSWTVPSLTNRKIKYNQRKNDNTKKKILPQLYSITNNSIKHHSFVFTQLNEQTVLFLTIRRCM